MNHLRVLNQMDEPIKPRSCLYLVSI